MNSFLKAFLIWLAILFSFLYCKFQTFAFECYNGYWQNGNCVTEQWFYSFFSEQICRDEPKWKEDIETKAIYRNKIDNLTSEISQLQAKLAELEAEKNKAISDLVSMPMISYKEKICNKVEKYRFTKLVLPAEIMKVWADINYKR